MDRFIQYEVYEPINITKLNLSICDNMTIDIYTPVVLSEELLNLYRMGENDWLILAEKFEKNKIWGLAPEMEIENN